MSNQTEPFVEQVDLTEYSRALNAGPFVEHGEYSSHMSPHTAAWARFWLSHPLMREHRFLIVRHPHTTEVVGTLAFARYDPLPYSDDQFQPEGRNLWVPLGSPYGLMSFAYNVKPEYLEFALMHDLVPPHVNEGYVPDSIGLEFTESTGLTNTVNTLEYSDGAAYLASRSKGGRRNMRRATEANADCTIQWTDCRDELDLNVPEYMLVEFYERMAFLDHREYEQNQLTFDHAAWYAQIKDGIGGTIETHPMWHSAAMETPSAFNAFFELASLSVIIESACDTVMRQDVVCPEEGGIIAINFSVRSNELRSVNGMRSGIPVWEDCINMHRVSLLKQRRLGYFTAYNNIEFCIDAGMLYSLSNGDEDYKDGLCDFDIPYQAFTKITSAQLISTAYLQELALPLVIDGQMMRFPLQVHRWLRSYERSVRSQYGLKMSVANHLDHTERLLHAQED